MYKCEPRLTNKDILNVFFVNYESIIPFFSKYYFSQL